MTDMNGPVERGPNYDWQHEAKHYRDKCEDYFDKWDKAVKENDRLHEALEEARKRERRYVAALTDIADGACVSCSRDFDARDALAQTRVGNENLNNERKREMNLDQMTLADMKKLMCVFGDKKEPTECCEQGATRIVILQRGWVMVGKYYQDGEDCRLESCSVIRNWGTTKGLGEIATHGPTDKTVLDPTPTTRFHALTVVASMDCKESKWAKHV